MRTPTFKQYRTLLSLGSGAYLVGTNRPTIAPLHRHGWVTCRPDYSWARITPAGLHALAAAADKYGLPEPSPELRRSIEPRS